MGIADVLAENLGDKTKVKISAVVASIRKNSGSANAASEINGVSTEEIANEMEEIYDYFAGIIEFKGKSSEGFENVIAEVDRNLKVVDVRVGKITDVIATESGLVAGTEIATFVENIEEVAVPTSDYIKVRDTYANSPDLSGFNPESTYYVGYDEAGQNEKVLGRIDRVALDGNIIQTGDTNETSNIWFDYEGKEITDESGTYKRPIWGNVVTVTGDDVTYWTWIPRYVCNASATSASDLNIKFVSKDDEYKNSSGATEATTGLEVPKSFEFGTATSLYGYWISKYEVQNGSLDKVFSQVKNDILTVNTQNETGKAEEAKDSFTIFVEGKLYKTGQTMPLPIEGVKASKACDVCLYNETTKTIVGRTIKDTDNIEVDLSGFDPKHTYYITYDENGNNETIAGSLEKIKNKYNFVGTGDNNVWYNYDTKIWANVATVTGNDVTYWTYIPRYEYMEASNTLKDTKFISSSQKVADAGYEISEAFKFGGKENQKGYWISKYEVQDDVSNGVEKLIVEEQTSTSVKVKTTLTTGSDGRTYDIYLNGKKYNEDAVTLPQTVTVEAGEESSIMIYSINDKRIVGETSITTSDVIQVDGSGFDTNNTYYVLYNPDGTNERIGGKIELDAKGNIKKPDINEGVWYKYENKIWANVVTVSDGTTYDYENNTWVFSSEDANAEKLVTYWTYIPKYEYFEASTNSGKVVGTQFIPPDQTDADDGYEISKAFQFNGNTKQKGYWISKYEVQDSTQQTQ